MKHILKPIIGFSIVMCILGLIVVVKKYPDDATIAFLCVVSAALCYMLGNSVWNIMEDIFKDNE